MGFGFFRRGETEHAQPEQNSQETKKSKEQVKAEQLRAMTFEAIKMMLGNKKLAINDMAGPDMNIETESDRKERASNNIHDEIIEKQRAQRTNIEDLGVHDENFRKIKDIRTQIYIFGSTPELEEQLIALRQEREKLYPNLKKDPKAAQEEIDKLIAKAEVIDDEEKDWKSFMEDQRFAHTIDFAADNILRSHQLNGEKILVTRHEIITAADKWFGCYGPSRAEGNFGLAAIRYYEGVLKDMADNNHNYIVN